MPANEKAARATYHSANGEEVSTTASVHPSPLVPEVGSTQGGYFSIFGRELKLGTGEAEGNSTSWGAG